MQNNRKRGWRFEAQTSRAVALTDAHSLAISQHHNPYTHNKDDERTAATQQHDDNDD